MRSITCDVVVVGAGPAGASAAAHLARAGRDVIVLERAVFPRDKVCGGGLTPRAVRELVELGLAPPERWKTNRGLRVYGGGHVLELPWPETSTYPSFGLATTRRDLDHTLVEHARACGARIIEGATVTGPLLDHARRVTGVTARLSEHAHDGGPSPRDEARPAGAASDGSPPPRDEKVVSLNSRHGNCAKRPSRGGGGWGGEGWEGGEGGEGWVGWVGWEGPGEVSVLAPIVLAADGAASRLALAVGRERLPRRPVGVALRATFRAERTDARADDFLESHLELWAGPPGRSHLLPGYGWVFPLAGGMINVGCGSVSTRPTPTINWQTHFSSWLPHLPGWELDAADTVDPPRSAPLPMAFNRKPLAQDGLLLLGDAAGLVSPFNGEGIPHALLSGRLAAAAANQALSRSTPDKALAAYPRHLAHELGGYYTLGRIFVELIEHPAVMRLCTRYGLPRRTLMGFTMKLLSGLYDERHGNWMDQLIATLARLAPDA